MTFLEVAVLLTRTARANWSRTAVRSARACLAGALLAGLLAACGSDPSPGNAGQLDKSFGAGTADGSPDGAVSASLGNGNDTARAVVIQSDGKIVIAGTTVAGDGSTNIVVARFNTDGTPDTSFSSPADPTG